MFKPVSLWGTFLMQTATAAALDLILRRELTTGLHLSLSADSGCFRSIALHAPAAYLPTVTVCEPKETLASSNAFVSRFIPLREVTIYPPKTEPGLSTGTHSSAPHTVEIKGAC